jgi:hypothetical protein
MKPTEILDLKKMLTVNIVLNNLEVSYGSF